MILIFGGTTEGRIAAATCDTAMKPFFYSTKSGDQKLCASNINILTGDMACADIVSCCKEHQIELIVDASHPFATNLHDNIVEAAKELNIQTVRFDRHSNDSEQIVRFASLDEALTEVRNRAYDRTVALTGVSSASKLLPLVDEKDIFLRIMDRADSWKAIDETGFPHERIIVYDKDNKEKRDSELLQLIDSKKGDSKVLLITKESGQSGGFDEKVEMAERLGLDLFVIARPEQPIYSKTVYGKYGLRRAIEQLLPTYFPLRTGFTTGTVATAATIAAAEAAITEQMPNEVKVILPNAEPMLLTPHSFAKTSEGVRVSMIKDAGDDPDVTNGIEICAEVKLLPEANRITLKGGEGVGIVTLPGIGIEIGESAINPVPRKMIVDNVTHLMSRLGYNEGIEIVITVPKGRKIAKRTFNERLGIINGISILGTSGIVQPFSNEAFLESIRQHIKIVHALGYKRVIINSGAKSENIIKSRYKDAPNEIFIHYGNLIGDTLSICREEGITNVVLGIMIGKAVKLAAGYLDTHSKRSLMDKEFLIGLAEQVGCDNQTIEKIREMTVARKLWEIVTQESFFALLTHHCYNTCAQAFDINNLKIELIDEICLMERG